MLRENEKIEPPPSRNRQIQRLDLGIIVQQAQRMIIVKNQVFKAATLQAPVEMACPVRRVSAGPKQHFFGYYDRCPWSYDGRFLIAHETENPGNPTGAMEEITMGVIDLEDNNNFIPVGKSRMWKWQMGAMPQWINENSFVYNDVRQETAVAVIYCLNSGEERVIPYPVFILHPGAEKAYSLTMGRVGRGYGYQWLKDPNQGVAFPENDGVWELDLNSGKRKLLVSIAEAVEKFPGKDMVANTNWFNHCQVSPKGSKVAFLHRWWTNPDKSEYLTHLLTANEDGSDLRYVSITDFVSHYDWFDEDLIWAGISLKNEPGTELYQSCLFDRDGNIFYGVGSRLPVAGHCNFHVSGEWITTDDYPDPVTGDRQLSLYDLVDRKVIIIGNFPSTIIEGGTRCDLHPRWSRNGMEICIDSVHEGSRQLYIVDVSSIVSS